jgi:glycosyltransferase involved in cell wall biosynthesis
MKISIITVCYNSSETIRNTIDSVISQSYDNIEYIIIDGGSSDNTKEIVLSYGSSVSSFVSEQDRGIYHAMNKGIKMSTGEVVGILNSDDFFNNDKVIERVVGEFESNDIDALYGDIQFVNPDNLQKVVRYYSSKRFSTSKFKYGYMPAHPSFYVKREYFEKLGYYKEDYKIGADFELLLRFLYNNKLKSSYIQMPFVTMRTGGISTRSIRSNFILNNEIIRACRENGINTNLFIVYLKYLFKIFEIINCRK